MGARGPIGPVPSKASILAAVEDQFYDIRRQLSIQLSRTAQVQQQLDEHKREMAEMRLQLQGALDLLKKWLSKD